MNVSLKRVPNGYALFTDEEIGNCNCCKKEIEYKYYSFFWCESTKLFYCRKCVRTKEASKVCSRWPHTDWHIVAVYPTSEYDNIQALVQKEE